VVGSKLDALKKYVQSRGWAFGPSVPIQYGEQVTITYGSHLAKINYYPKRDKIVVGGPDSPLKIALSNWVDENASDGVIAHGTGGSQEAQIPPTLGAEYSKKDASSLKSFNIPHVGMDESGKGDWFGPLVVAAVFVNEETQRMLREIGVRDSKLLKPHVIKQLASQIEDIIPPDQRHVLTIEPELYNQLYDQYKNINLLLADVYAQVAYEVWKGTQASSIVCDQFSQKADRLENAFVARMLPTPIQQHHAEQASIAVSAASILASSAFSDALQQMGKAAGIGRSLPKGASDAKELMEVAQHVMNQGGATLLGQYAKLNFAPIQAFLSSELPPLQESRDDTPFLVHIEHATDSVKIAQPAWQVNYHRSGFWRFNFADGGMLDWYARSTGRLDLRGKQSAASYSVLREKVRGRTYGPAINRDDEGKKLRLLQESVEKYVPKREVSISEVPGVGWRHKSVLWGERFDFTDGAILWYYPSTGTLAIQGKLSEPTRKALEELLTFSWSRLDSLINTLRRIFPDWELGSVEDENEPIEIDSDYETWKAMDNALDWRSFWPENRPMRLAANQKGRCQEEFLKDWSSILAHKQEKKHLLAHAPTGIGKTISALVPAIAWVAKAPHRRRVYYLVNRVTQHENPLRELKNFLGLIFYQQTKLPLHVVDLVGRGQFCLYPKSQSLKKQCKRSGVEADWDKLPSGIASWQEVDAHMKADGQMCPYHTLQSLMPRAHVIICDYWWLFSQITQEKGLAKNAGFSPIDSILIVDEAHNLPQRVRDESSVEAPIEDIERALKSVEELEAYSILGRIMLKVKNIPLGTDVSPSQLLQEVGGKTAIQLALDTLIQDEMLLGDVHSSISIRLLRSLLQADDKVIIYTDKDLEGRMHLHFRLVDASDTLREGYKRVYASLTMSGTLSAPSDSNAELQYQLPIFGLPSEGTLTEVYASPFPLLSQRWIYTPDTLGTASDRYNYLDAYAAHILAIGKATPGVTAVFFSSYAFMNQVRAKFTDVKERALIVPEDSNDANNPDSIGGNLRDYERRLRTVVENHHRAYLFAVYKGKLAEGADFSDNLIKTVICVSLPLEHRALYHIRLEALYTSSFALIAEKLHDDPQMKAKEYAWDRSSLSLILQACGRGIRREGDTCMFVLLDKRYNSPNWRRFLEPKPFNLPDPEKTVEKFHLEAQVSKDEDGSWDEALHQAYRKRGA
jgi:ribonuclease HIII